MTAGRHVNTQSQSWCTPPKYVNAIKRFWNGIIHLDPCSNEHSIVHAETEFRLPEHDGLKEEWNFENWGIKYWSKTPEFIKYEEEH